MFINGNKKYHSFKIIKVNACNLEISETSEYISKTYTVSTVKIIRKYTTIVK